MGKRTDNSSATKDPTEQPPPFARLHLWQIQAVRDILLVIAVIVLFWAGYALRAVTVPLLVALLLAYLFEPLIQRMSRTEKISRAGAVTTLLVSVGSLFIIVLALSLPLVVSQTIQVIDDVRSGVTRQRVAQLDQYVPHGVRDEFNYLVEQLPAGSLANRTLHPSASPDPVETTEDGEPTDEAAIEPAGDAAPTPPVELVEINPDQAEMNALIEQELAPIREELAALAAQMEQGTNEQKEASDVWAVAKRSTAAIFSILGALISFGLLAFLIPFYFFFFSLWYPEVVKFGRTLVPNKNSERTLDLLKKMDAVVAGFVRGRIVISMIMGVMLAIGWMIIGVPYALPAGLIVGVFCAVPYLGGIGVPLAVGLLFYGELGEPQADRMAWWGILLWPSLWFGVVQMIEGYALTPLIAGKATKLDPVTIVVVVLAGGSIMGVYGMLLAIPAAACGKILIMEVLMPRIRAWMRGEISDPLPIEKN